MSTRFPSARLLALALMAAWSALSGAAAVAAPLALRDVPIFLNDSVAPLNMLVVSRDHKLYYEAYNDASDLDGDGKYDIGFQPTITYYGYFDSAKCYNYSGGIFVPAGGAGALNTCSSKWSGNFLNYVTTARIDALRKVLYGGSRYTDSAGTTVLQRTYVPQDAHTWGKTYTSFATDGYLISSYTPLAQPTAGLRHLFANVTMLADPAQLPLMRVVTNINAVASDWVSIETPVANNIVTNTALGTVAITSTDYTVRVQVCVPGLLESNCTKYPNGNYKPTGLLQDYGENDTMMFGLLTGSYQKNLDGGVLRKRVGTFKDEENPATGQFLMTDPGIIRTLDRLKIAGFAFPSYGYFDPADNCGWVNSPLTSGRCRDWGNPIAEMMYEALRYFAGKGAPTAAFDIANSGNPDSALGLSHPTWDNPYAAGKPACAKPFETVISDTTPSFDSDQVPGNPFNGFSGDLTGFNASTLGQTIWNNEFGGSRSIFIGQVGGTYDGAPTAKTASSFANIRGLAPEEPTKQGSFNAASVAYYGLTNDLNPAAGQQKVETFVIALESPLPRIEIPVAGGKITIAPFAKTVGGCDNPDRTPGAFQSTDGAIDFYLESMAPDGKSGSFRVNFDDKEEGGDHDMDAIARYTFALNADNTVTITVTSLYGVGCNVQHIGYVLSGAGAQDGTYLVIRDIDTNGAAGLGNNYAGGDVDYFLDRPPGNAAWNDGQPLPLTSTRTFTPASTAATFLKSPLWYAAKWGGFTDSNANNLPDVQAEWDGDAPTSPDYGTPDNYFLVTNALNLKAQLSKAFDTIVQRSASVASAAVSSSVIRTDTKTYSASFTSSSWSGNLIAQPIALDGTIGAQVWSAASAVPTPANRRIATVNTNGSAVPFQWGSLDSTRQGQLTPENVTATGQERLNWVRGDRTLERRNGGAYRNRDPLSVLGDFINSAPLFVKQPPFRYPDSLEAVTYNSFRAAQVNRQGMLYIGGNDGMLHAFNSDTGAETWAFIPNQAFPLLKAQTDTTYQHKYSVDGSPTIGDAFFGGAWNSVLITPLGFGGQGLFAMNVTNPAAANEASVASKYMWEFTDATDVDMGLAVSKPVVVRLKNGKWAAIFGNGYNNTTADGRVSSTGDAVLYVVDVQTGALLKKIDTGVGMAADPLATGRPNGLASPTAVDVDGDSITDYVYAGDLFGNLWKFDLRDPSSGNWKVSYTDSSSKPAPLFVAKDSSNRRQPITTRPQVGRGPLGIGLYVYFGTGKYLELADRIVANLTPQTLYGVMDANTGGATDVVSGRAALTQQTINLETSVSGSTVRITSNNPIGATMRGWYMDLIAPGNVFQGEMNVTDSVLRDTRLFVTTLIPNADPCGYGGTSWLMILNSMTGGPNDASFDLNGDNKFNTDDQYNDGTNGYAVSGKQFDSALAKPTIITNGTVDVILLQGPPADASDGSGGGGNQGTGPTGEKTPTPPGFYGRQSWRQLH